VVEISPLSTARLCEAIVLRCVRVGDEARLGMAGRYVRCDATLLHIELVDSEQLTVNSRR
jgi:hypothetical protein